MFKFVTKKLFVTQALLLGCLLCLALPGYGAVVTADQLANAKTQATLTYLQNLPTGTANRVVVGQHTYINSDTNYSSSTNVIEGIHNSTGKYVGLVGIDYFYQNSTSTNNKIITWANGNCLITIVDHLNNPVSNGTAWDTTNVDLTQMITSGTSLNTKFNGVLDTIANGLSYLQSNNVTVLFRPFHEMNGSWFWWGAKDSTQYKNLWIYTFNYLTTTKGLHNLLWVWSPNASIDWSYYPGAAYVDVIGADVYNTQALSGPISGYSQLSTNAPGKPFALTEVGPCDPSNGCTASADIMPVLNNIKNYMPKTTYFMEWAGSYELVGDYVYNTASLFADSWSLTQDKMPTITGGTTTDTTAPTTAISSPAAGATVSGTYSVTATASDNVGVTKVEFYLNGTLKATDTTAPYLFSWDTTTVTNGAYTLTTKAYDAAGNVGQSAAVTVTVNNVASTTPPAVAITSPAANATVSGTVTVAATATDSVGISKVEFYDNGTLCAAVNTAPYSFNWNTASAGNGSHTQVAKAYDTAGNVGQSASVTVTVNNAVADTTAPTTAISAPAAGATVSGSITVTASASDNVGVTKVEFYVDGALKATDTASPYTFTLSTTTLANGAHTLATKAYDAAGNVGQSATVTVTVNNAATTTTTYSFWPATAAPTIKDAGADKSLELGVKFKSDVNGYITGIRFYKSSKNTGTHTGSLWTSSGQLLATATFTNETASGWQQVNFSTPVAIAANTVYVASYHCTTGHYSNDQNFFASKGVDAAPLHALANGVSGPNGLYAFGSSTTFPNQSWLSSNYWVDVVFKQ